MNFDFSQNYQLENERVRLTPLIESDFENLLPFSVNEPELWTYSLVQAIGEEGLKYYLSIALDGRKNEKEYAFIVFDKKTNQYAGCTRFYDIQLAQNTTQLGYTWYGKEFQRTGLNQNCKYLMLEFAFEKMNFERVEFRADNDNVKSIAAMKNIGCVQEGILRNHGFKPDGSRRDSIVLSILKVEWFQTVKTNLLIKMEDIYVSTVENKLDKELIHSFLKNTYWAKDRTMETVEKCLANSLNFGIFKNKKQIGYARVVTDYCVFAYLLDVFIIEKEQKKGYSKILLDHIFNHPELQNITTWRLATSDAKELYVKFGFRPLSTPDNMMEKLKNSK